MRTLAVIGAWALLTVGCADSGTPTDETPPAPELPGGGKFDVPNDSDIESCQRRRADALAGNEAVFTETAIRWACADAEGVNTNNFDNRGQEYCEHFAIVQLPPAVEGEEPPGPLKLGALIPNPDNDFEPGNTPLGVELTLDQIIALEEDPDAIAGACIFTSWHEDIRAPAPSCIPDGESCTEVLGLPLLGEHFRMKLGVNSNDAARLLIEDCYKTAAPVGNPENDADPLHDEFTRACMLNADINETAWRRSDNAICAVINRLRECGCGLDGGYDLFDALLLHVDDMDWEDEDEAQYNVRGFPLGGWAGKETLPPGCRYVEVGDFSRTVVQCNLTALEVINHADEVKKHCIAKYADKIVVHVPLPQTPIVCEPADDAAYPQGCQEKPWVIGG